MGDVRKGKMGNLLCLVNGREGLENGWKKIEGIGVSGKWGEEARERREESRGENSENKGREKEKEERVEKEK